MSLPIRPGTIATALALSLGFPVSDAVRAQDEAALGPYEACLETLVLEEPLERRISACQRAAEAGIPTAQYVLGLLLLDEGDGETRAEASLRWLRLAAERGHPGALLETARILREGRAGPTRPDEARRFLERAVCTGLPQALREARDLGLDPATLEAGCLRASWGGAWSGEVTWVHASLGVDEPRGRTTRLRLELGDEPPRVFTEHEGSWIELKPGGFRWAERGTNAVLVAFDEGWDLDGKWVETSNLSLVRVAPDAIEVGWTRMIHNEHMPRSLEGRTLTAVARGLLRRAAGDDPAD